MNDTAREAALGNAIQNSAKEAKNNKRIAELESTLASVTRQRDSAWLVAEHREKNVEYEKKLEVEVEMLRKTMKRVMRIIVKDGHESKYNGRLTDEYQILDEALKRQP